MTFFISSPPNIVETRASSETNAYLSWWKIESKRSNRRAWCCSQITSEQCEIPGHEIIEQTLKKIDGGYQVGLSWIQNDVRLPPSYDATVSHLTKIEKKMNAIPTFAKKYTKQIDNLLEKGYAMQCHSTERSSAVCWHLPHFAVQNPNKPEKQRLVRDTSKQA